MVDTSDSDGNFGTPREVGADSPSDDPEAGNQDAADELIDPGDVEPIPPLPVGGPYPIDPTPVYPYDGPSEPIPPLPVGGPHPIDPTPIDWSETDPFSFVIIWDGQVAISGEGRRRVELAVRRVVLNELAEQAVEHDLGIIAVDEGGTRGIRIQRL
jgi:hypothetical protein